MKKEERVLQRRQKFIDAGIEIFGTEGYQSTTVRKLCKEAGLTDRYYYESFKSLEDLLIAAFDQSMRHIQRQIMLAVPEAHATTDLPVVINRILDAFFATMEDERVARLITLEVVGVSKTVDRVANKGLFKLVNLIVSLGRGLHPRWTVSDEQATLLGMSVLGAMRQAAIHWVVNDYKMKRCDVVSTASMLILGLLTVIEEQANQIEHPVAK